MYLTQFLMCSADLNMAPLVSHATRQDDVQSLDGYWQAFHW